MKKSWIMVVAGVFAAVLSGQAPKPYGPHDKASYIDAATAQFVNPGLTITINSASIAADGTITTTYALTDPTGLPLDNAGVNTPGAISLSYVAAYIPQTQEQYVAYTTRTVSGTAIATTIQAGSDSGGTLTALGAGQYQYVFKTKAPAGFDATATTRSVSMVRAP